MEGKRLKVAATRQGQEPAAEANPFAVAQRPGPDEAVENALDGVLELFPREQVTLSLRQRLRSWLERYEAREQQLVVLEEMRLALKDFPENERSVAAPHFVQLRVSREAANAATAALGAVRIGWGASAALGGLGSIALFSLTLVLLNIERNTRGLRARETA